MRTFPNVAVVAIALCCAQQGAAQIPQQATALEGVPRSQVEVTAETTARRLLDEATALKSQLRIRIDNGRYYWASRQDRPLTVTSAGEFTYLMSNEPGQYVRIRRVDNRLSYVEHLDTQMGSVTYWGELRVVLGKP
jgi:hypothetical protein